MEITLTNKDKPTSINEFGYNINHIQPVVQENIIHIINNVYPTDSIMSFRASSVLSMTNQYPVSFQLLGDSEDALTYDMAKLQNPAIEPVVQNPAIEPVVQNPAIEPVVQNPAFEPDEDTRNNIINALNNALHDNPDVQTTMMRLAEEERIAGILNRYRY